jgi:predicted transcriptional regulator
MDENRDDVRLPGLSESEVIVLKALWALGSATVREVNELLADRGRRWAYTTVQTLLLRLQQKGCVECLKHDVAHTFRPKVTRERLLQQRLDALEADFCDGTTTPLVHALVSGKRFTAEEIAHFRRLLDELEPGEGGRGTRNNTRRKPKS